MMFPVAWLIIMVSVLLSVEPCCAASAFDLWYNSRLTLTEIICLFGDACPAMIRFV